MNAPGFQFLSFSPLEANHPAFADYYRPLPHNASKAQFRLNPMRIGVKGAGVSNHDDRQTGANPFAERNLLITSIRRRI